MLSTCRCSHAAQDKFHGKGIRVFNPCKDKAHPEGAIRCSVCRAVKSKTAAL